ncbi:MAG: hypothetical protein OHK0046_05660 [Anaerolineae bacterium]
MGQNPPTRPNVLRIVLSGAVLGALGIGAFIGVWILLGSMGVADFPRLVAAICVPPGILMIGIILYILIARPFEPRR